MNIILIIACLLWLITISILLISVINGVNVIINGIKTLIFKVNYLSDNKSIQKRKGEYIVIEFPDIQDYMDLEGFEENCHLINDDVGLEKYGPAAYLVNVQWLSDMESNV